MKFPHLEKICQFNEGWWLGGWWWWVGLHAGEGWGGWVMRWVRLVVGWGEGGGWGEGSGVWVVVGWVVCW